MGGCDTDFEANKPLLEDLSKALHYVGAGGKAFEVKRMVNMVMNINTAALAEGLGIADALGIDMKMRCDIFTQTGANSRVLETDAADMILRDQQCIFSASHAAKDSGIALGLAAANGIQTPLAQATFEQYTKLTEMGQVELDKSGIAELTFKGRSA